MKTITLPESEIITLADAAKKHGTVELAKTIGVGKSQLYRILRGHNRVTPATADKISAWLSTGIPKPEEPLKKRPFKSCNFAISRSCGPSCRSFHQLERSEVSAACRCRSRGSDSAGPSDEYQHHNRRVLQMWRLTYYMAGIVSGMLGGAALVIVIHG